MHLLQERLYGVVLLHLAEPFHEVHGDPLSVTLAAFAWFTETESERVLSLPAPMPLPAPPEVLENV